jgi:hypothetical protein
VGAGASRPRPSLCRLLPELADPRRHFVARLILAPAFPPSRLRGFGPVYKSEQYSPGNREAPTEHREINWPQLARNVGSNVDNRTVRGGTRFAQAALETILGPRNIRTAVELALDEDPSAELIMNVLMHLRSDTATQLGYEAYRSSTGRRATRAVWLIKHIAHPVGLT